MNLADLFPPIRIILTSVAILIGLFLVVINGYKLMTSQGEPRKVQDSKEGLTSAIIGIIFVILATVVLNFVITGFLGT